MTCDVIATGSKGNAVLLNGKYLFDCGVSLRKIKPYLKSLEVVFLTHIHLDHFRSTTIYEIHKRRPAVRFVCSRNLLVPLCTVANVSPDNVVLVTPEKPSEIRLPSETVRIRAVELIHNVENVGWVVDVEGGESPGKAMYATDTQYIPVQVPGLDLYMVECNHQVDDLKRRRERRIAAGGFVYEDIVAVAHMSQETVTSWLAQNAGPNSEVVFLHQHIEKAVTEPDE